MSALIAGGIVSGLLLLAKKLEGSSSSSSAPARVAAGQSSPSSVEPDFAELQTANAYRQMVEDHQTFHTVTPLPHATEATSSATPLVRVAVGGHAVAVAPRAVAPVAPRRAPLPVAPRPVAPRVSAGATASSGARIGTRAVASRVETLY